MASAMILSTWSFGRRANAAGWAALQGGGSALDAVEAAGRDAEGDVNNHTVGRGGFPDRDGVVSLDACVMLAPDRCGGVCAVRTHEAVVSIARAVMEHTPHTLLAGEGAERFADERGFARVELLTEAARRKGGARGANLEERSLSVGEAAHDTIGILAIDDSGVLAGACTTSGLPGKLPGRVGDSPIIGHGLYVVPGIGAAVCTGRGELVSGVCGSFLAVETMRRGGTARDAADDVLRRFRDTYRLEESDQVGVITLAASGEWSAAAIRNGFSVAVRSADRDELVPVAMGQSCET